MPRYKHIDTEAKLLPVDLARQLLPGTFEHAVHHLIEHELDLSAFDARFHNDATGAPAYPPALLLKVVLVAYAHGVVSSRGIERLCQEQVIFIALCGDHAPHFTTIAHFVSTLKAQGHSVQVQRVPADVYDTFFPGAPEMRETFQYFEQHFYFGPEREQRIAAANALCPEGFIGFSEWAKANLAPTWANG